VWQALKTALDISQLRPAQAEGAVARALSDRAGLYYVLKNPKTHTYLRLSPREYWVWERLDGTCSIHDLVVAYFLAHGTFALDLIVSLVQQLYAKQLLREQPQFVFSSLSSELAKRTLVYKLIWPARVLLTREWAIGNLDGVLSGLYRRGGWLCYTWPAQLLYLLVSVVGMYLFLRMLGDTRFPFLGKQLGLGVAMLWLAAILPVVIHELGHALTTKHYGCEVHRGGLMLYFGAPAAFMDTSDIWMEGRRPRLAVTWAGPYTGFILGGLCALVLWWQPDLALTPFLFQMATISYLISVLNLNPLLKFDGYYLLADALEMPQLRERSLAFVRRVLVPKLRKRERFSGEERLFVVFGLLAILWAAYVIFASLITWNSIIISGVQALLAGVTDLGALIINVLLILLSSSFLALIGVSGYRATRRLVAAIHRSGLLADPLRLGLAMGLGAVMLALPPALLVPPAAPWIDGLLGLGGLIGGLWLAWTAARALRGSPSAGAWWSVMAGLALLIPAHGLLALPWLRMGAVARALDLGSLALAGAALAIGWRLIAGLAGSWRATSVALVALGWASLAPALVIEHIPTLLSLHTLAALLIATGLAHWHTFQPAPIVPRQWMEQPRTTREQLQAACDDLAAWLLDDVRQTYGQRTARRITAQLDRQAQAFGWGIGFADGQIAPGPANARLASSSVADCAETLILALNGLLDTTARLVGRGCVRQALIRGYDALAWEQRELLGEYVLSEVPEAAGLAEQFAQPQSGVIELLTRAPLFVSFTAAEIRAISVVLRPMRFAQGATIIRQGEPGERFYLLQRGRGAVIQRDAQGGEHTIHELVRGDYFGETALLTGAPRNATIRALTPVEALTLSRNDFNRLLRAGFHGRRKVERTLQHERLLRRIPIFRDFDPFTLRQVAAQLESHTLESNAVVFRQGEAGDRFYIVERGEVAVRLRLPGGDEVEQGRLGPGEYFGEIALLMDVPRTATVATTQPTTLLTVQAETFNALVRDFYTTRRILQRTGSRRVLSNTDTARRASTAVVTSV
jgi:putative peptide zinc metalloprotease protein